jgi:hypothetical protein
MYTGGSMTAAPVRARTEETTGRERFGFGRRLVTETKHALKTTEFYAFVVTFVLILIAGNAIESEEGGADRFAADDVWLYITILTVGYMVSRGLAKAGSREPYWQESGQNRNLDNGGRDRD